MDESFWRKVLFSDESYISIFSGKPVYARKPLGARFIANCVSQAPKHPLSVMIWGCFSYHGLGRIMVVNGTMKSKDYILCLERKMITSAKDLFRNEPFVFQDDSAPCHRSKLVKEWHKTHGTEQLEWPGNSPDLNPIENLWAILKQKVHQKSPKNREELISAIVRSWYHEISAETCQNLVKSMKERLRSVILAQGGHIKY